jgi:hypothetical protein
MGAWAGQGASNSSSPTGSTTGNQLTNETKFDERRFRSGGTGGKFSGGGLLTVNECFNMAACIDGTSNTMVVSEIGDYFFNRTGRTKFDRRRIDASAVGNNGPGGRWFVGANTNQKMDTTQKGGSIGNSVVFNLTTIRTWNSNGAVCIGFNGKNTTTNFFGTNNSGINNARGPNHPLLSAHPNIVLGVFMDGHTQGLQKTLAAVLAKGLATRDDGQQIADF